MVPSFRAALEIALAITAADANEYDTVSRTSRDPVASPLSRSHLPHACLPRVTPAASLKHGVVPRDRVVHTVFRG